MVMRESGAAGSVRARRIGTGLVAAGLIGAGLGGAGLAGGAAAATPAYASPRLTPTLTVTTLADSAAPVGECSLRAAITAANTDAPVGGCPAGSGADTIDFAVSGKITLGSTLPPPTSTVVIDGGGTITLDGAGSRRIFTVPAGGSLELQRLVLQRGRAGDGDGGAVLSAGALVLVDCTVQDSIAAGSGGGISSAGSAFSLTRTIVRRNRAAVNGGGLAVAAATSGATVAMDGASISANIAYAQGGGVWLDATVAGDFRLEGMTFSENHSDQAAGIRASMAVTDAWLTLTESTIRDNVAHADPAGGLALFAWKGARIVVSASTISGNSARRFAGGAWVPNYGGDVTLANCTVYANSAGGYAGGLYLSPFASVRNCTVTRNAAPDMSGLVGGAIANTVVLGNLPIDGRPTTRAFSIVGGMPSDVVLDPAGLADNGGLTRTVALVPSGTNPARGTGDVGTCAAAPVSGVDQREVPRISCDLGAYQTAARPAPTMTLTPMPERTVYGQQVLLTVQASGPTPQSPVPTGAVTFWTGAVPLGSATLDPTGAAALSTMALPAGIDEVWVVYTGDAAYGGGVSPSVLVRVTPASTVTTLWGPGAATRFGVPVTFLARVSVVAPGGGMPGGRVQFRSGAVILGSAAVDVGGLATLTVQRMPVGRHSVTAYYLGTDDHAASSSAVVTHTVLG